MPVTSDPYLDRPTWAAMLGRWNDSDARAVASPAGHWTGREVLARAAGAASWLDDCGVGPGVVPALLSGSAPALAVVIGGMCTGRPVAPLNPRFTARELHAVVERLDSPVLLTEPEAEEVAQEVCDDLGMKALTLPSLPGGDRELPLHAQPDDLAFVLHTSGTTSLPKSVPYRQDVLANRIRVNAAMLALGPGAVYATASPFHHISGLGMFAVASGAGTTLVPIPRFTVDGWQALRTLGITHVTTVPTVLQRLLDHGVLGFETLRLVQYGASPIPIRTVQRVIDELPGVDLIQLFGQTEGTPITWLSPADHRQAADEDIPDILASVGRAVSGLELRIENPDDVGVGEVIARAVHLARPDADGWLRTGDLGRLDESGRLYLTGRRGDKIIRGGENIYPVEIEAVLEEHPGVREACVVGMPDEGLGEVPKAFLVAADPQDLPAWEELRAFTRERLSGYKVPAHWDWVDELPRNATGKLLRRNLIRQENPS